MGFINKGRSVAVIEEASFNAGGTFTDTDYVDYLTCDITADVQKLDREVIRNSLLPLESALGQETSSGSVSVEIGPTSDDGTTLNGDKLFKNGVGKKFAYVSGLSVSGSASTTTDVDLLDATGLNEGQVVKIKVGTAEEITTITAITTNTITVFPALSAAPADGAAVAGMLTYIIPRPADTVPSLAVREHLEDTTGATKIDYDYKGVVVTGVALSYPVGQICKATFNTTGADFTVNTTASGVNIPCALTSPVIGKHATFVFYPDGGTKEEYAGQDVNVSIDTTTTNVETITTGGIQNILGVMKTCTGSFKTEYEGLTNFTRFKEGTSGLLSIELSLGQPTDPKVTGIIAPHVRFTKVSRSEDGGIFYDNVDFEALSPSCDGNERAISVWFGPNVAL